MLIRNGIRYGTNIRTYLFEPLDDIRDLLTNEIRLAIDTWEPRVRVLDVVLKQPRDRELEVTIDYEILETRRQLTTNFTAEAGQ